MISGIWSILELFGRFYDQEWRKRENQESMLEIVPDGVKIYKVTPSLIDKEVDNSSCTWRARKISRHLYMTASPRPSRASHMWRPRTRLYMTTSGLNLIMSDDLKWRRQEEGLHKKKPYVTCWSRQSKLARGVADIVLVITFAYELGFRWFKSPREVEEEIYNLVKKSWSWRRHSLRDDAITSLFVTS